MIALVDQSDLRELTFAVVGLCPRIGRLVWLPWGCSKRDFGCFALAVEDTPSCWYLTCCIGCRPDFIVLVVLRCHTQAARSHVRLSILPFPLSLTMSSMLLNPVKPCPHCTSYGISL